MTMTSTTCNKGSTLSTDQSLSEKNRTIPTIHDQLKLPDVVGAAKSFEINLPAPATLISPEKTIVTVPPIKLTTLDADKNTMEVDGEEVDEEVLHPPKKSKFVKTLSDGHNAIRVSLDKGIQELSDKVGLSEELKEEVASKRLKVWLFQENLRSTSEKCDLVLQSFRKAQKEQNSLFEELIDMRWKTREAKMLAMTVSSKLQTIQAKCCKFKNDLAKVESLESKLNPTKNEIKARINQLQIYKSGLENRDVNLCSISNGNKMLEIEQRKREVHNAIHSRPARFESMLAAIKQKEDEKEHLKKTLETTKETNVNVIKRQKGHELYLTQTERRLQRSLDYYQSKIDHGSNVPPPPPWFKYPPTKS